MKKITAILILIVIMVLECIPALAANTWGPKQKVTLHTATKKTSHLDAAHVYVDYIQIGGNGFYICWITDVASNKCVTGDMYFEPVRERKTIIYREKYKEYVKKDRKYKLVAQSNKSVAEGEKGTIETSGFVP